MMTLPQGTKTQVSEHKPWDILPQNLHRSFQQHFTPAANQAVLICWPYLTLFRPLTPWISFSPWLLHLLLLFRTEVPAEAGQEAGAGGRERLRHRKNMKDRISNTLGKRRC